MQHRYIDPQFPYLLNTWGYDLLSFTFLFFECSPSRSCTVNFRIHELVYCFSLAMSIIFFLLVENEITVKCMSHADRYTWWLSHSVLVVNRLRKQYTYLLSSGGQDGEGEGECRQNREVVACVQEAACAELAAMDADRFSSLPRSGAAEVGGLSGTVAVGLEAW